MTSAIKKNYVFVLDVGLSDEDIADEIRTALAGNPRRANGAGARNLFHLLCDQAFQSRFFSNVFSVLAVNVSDDRERLGWRAFDPYFDAVNAVACTAGALENPLVSDERMIVNRCRTT